MPAFAAHARLLLDILSMKLFVRLLVWFLGLEDELLDSDLFFFDRYSALADYHRMKGRTAKADRLAALAEAYFRAAPGNDEPPEAAAAAMAVPQPFIRTDAVSTIRLNHEGAKDTKSLSPTLRAFECESLRPVMVGRSTP